MSKIDRFGITIEFLSDDEKSDIYSLTTELSNILDDWSPTGRGDTEETSEGLSEKLHKFTELFN